MCHRCNEIDEKITRYRKLAKSASDLAVLNHLNAFILDLEADKGKLHLSAKE
jgi:hypothetical protein